MSDQISKLKALKVQAEALRGDTTKAVREAIYKDLNGQVLMKLLYVAPEMLSKSSALISTLQSLHSRGKLVRIVVDEAHCISSWGHDFRPEYSKLPQYFANIKGVPIMALTATATPQAVIDIRQSLRIQNSALFISSFVRSNLQYDIIPKSASAFRNLLTLLKARHLHDSGIVYCLSRQDCEEVEQQMKQIGLSAVAYHAKLSNSKRELAQRLWARGEIKIICATIAFGMGIDKPDVRFVIHHSISSSIEAYYQETGRAGRDGLPSQCILMYSFTDHVRYLRLFQYEAKGGSAALKQHRLSSLYQMLGYCENVTTCKRKLLVEHFGEFYDAEHCRSSMVPCNFCEMLKSRGSIGYKPYDFTEEVVRILESIKQLKSTTLNNLVDLYRGKKPKNANRARIETQLSLYNRGVNANEEDVQRLVRKLLIDGYLTERLEKMKVGRAEIDVCYVSVSKTGESFLSTAVKPKFYCYLSTSKNKSWSLSNLCLVSEKTVLKEKYKLKHFKVFRKAHEELKELMFKIAQEEGADNPYNILSAEGIEQLAAMLPRTKSEILQVESMTPDNYVIYGPRITPILHKYWNELDRLEHEDIKRIVGSL